MTDNEDATVSDSLFLDNFKYAANGHDGKYKLRRALLLHLKVQNHLMSSLSRKRGEGSANSSGETKMDEAKEDGKVEDNVGEMAEKEDEPTATKDDEDNSEGESTVEEEDTVEEYEDYSMQFGVDNQDLENFDG